MAGKKGSSGSRAQAAWELIRMAKDNPYLRRLLEDRNLQRRLRTALGAMGSAYGRAANNGAPARALLEDRKLQRDLLAAIAGLREVAKGLREQPSAARGGRSLLRRSLVVVGLGSLVAVAASKSARGKVLDLLFGKEEQFTYSPPPGTASPQQAAEYSREG